MKKVKKIDSTVVHNSQMSRNSHYYINKFVKLWLEWDCDFT